MCVCERRSRARGKSTAATADDFPQPRDTTHTRQATGLNQTKVVCVFVRVFEAFQHNLREWVTVCVTVWRLWMWKFVCVCVCNLARDIRSRLGYFRFIRANVFGVQPERAD